MIFLISNYKGKFYLLVKNTNEIEIKESTIKTEYRKKYENLRSNIESSTYKK